MKVKVIMAGLMVLLALSLLACSSGPTGDSTEPEKPATKPSTTSYAAATTVEFYTCNDFADEPNITDEIEFTANKGVTVILCSNRTTGFQWNEEAQISDTSVVEQTGHSYAAPSASKVGAAGTEKFVFTGVNPGTATVSLEYSRDWEGGEKAEWTCTLTITVK